MRWMTRGRGRGRGRGTRARGSTRAGGRGARDPKREDERLTSTPSDVFRGSQFDRFVRIASVARARIVRRGGGQGDGEEEGVGQGANARESERGD